MNTLQSIDYPIYFNNISAELNRFIKQGNYSRFFVLTDEHTAKYCLPLLIENLDDNDNYDLIEINAGEESKSIDFCVGIWKMLIDFGADRNSLLINLGGGVITDLGGFAASTYKRGIDFVHVPTTLLAQVDASVGGKNGIDIFNLKNIIGTFTQPKAVFIEHRFLSTLPARQVKSGLAEMLKHGLIADAAYWQKLKQSDLENLNPELIYDSIAIKNDVVIADPKERGLRKILNFGHTIGHAIESYSLNNDENPLTHGEAVVAGMICETYLSHQKCGLSLTAMQEIIDTLLGLYGKYPLDESTFGQLNDTMRKDKKNQGGKINCSLLSNIGQCEIDNVCTDEELCDSLKYYASLEFEKA
ncbi:3-dehydroquinate synthase [uncultured Mucilaginibacter sp.]|uniref:3-dehydroquinate synthase n=1 Tax=uncultured Mucilaginibacter sp. TaxID=797541 RepID=UPI0025F81198|nr:3-dehydroquinate synthase [uncultured Mucilaginibacter sp.]